MYDYIVIFTDRNGIERIVLKTNSIEEAREACKTYAIRGDLTIYRAQETYRN